MAFLPPFGLFALNRASPRLGGYGLLLTLLSLALKLKMAWLFYRDLGKLFCAVFFSRSLGKTPHFRCPCSASFKLAEIAWLFYRDLGKVFCAVFFSRSLGKPPQFSCPCIANFKLSPYRSGLCLFRGRGVFLFIPHLIFLQTAVIRLTGICKKRKEQYIIQVSAYSPFRY